MKIAGSKQGSSSSPTIINVGISKKDSLDPEKVARLDALGFDWDPIETMWNNGFSELEKFFQRERHSNVIQEYKSEDGFKLGKWVGRQRTRKDKLTSDRKSRLESLPGWVW